MAKRPVIWGRGSSTNVQKVLWTVQELGVAHERRIVGGPFGGTDTAEYLVLNPNKTIPVWQEDGFVLWESQAITRHLARTHGRLYGRSDAERAHIDQLLDWTALVFWPPVRTLFLDVFSKGKSLHDTGLAEAAVEKTERNLSIAQRFFAPRSQQDFAIADISFGVCLHRLRGMGYAISMPHDLKAWHDRVKARPAFKIALGEDLDLPGHAE
jgi:glutathione S-transferase